MTSRSNRPSLFSRAASGLLGAVTVSVAVSAALFGTACKPDKMPFKADESRTFAGDVTVSGEELNRGYTAYTRYCYACHGENGDGKGPASYSLRPPPRDFTKGIFKFARMRSSDDFASDDDLVRIVKGGLHGSAMLPWDIQEEELRRILQYIKAFGPLSEDGVQEYKNSRWERVKKKTGKTYPVLEEFVPEADPWTGKEQAAVQLGKELYHLRAECVNCHPGYDTKESLYKMSVDASKRDSATFSPLKGFRDDLYHAQAKRSDEYGVQIMPPDFTMDFVRSAHPESRIADLYRILSFGVYPIMPAWKGAGLSDSDIYALAYYVKSLIDIRGTAAALELKERMTAQTAFEIPKEEEPKPAEQPAGDAAGDKKEGDPAAAGDKKDEKKPEDAKKEEPKKEEPKKEEPKK